ncbi:MAG: NAD(P)H-dependent oxidoreductase [Sphingomonadales bacterium]
MKALLLNCSLKANPETSHTEALMTRAASIFEDNDIACEIIRVADHNIGQGIAEDLGPGDDWPKLFEKVMDAAILVLGTPIWLGEKSSLATKVIERLYASSGRTNAKGQYLYYGKVAGAMATGNEDGGKMAARSILYGLQHIGYLIPPQADAYWVGEAGPGPSYRDAGTENAFTRRNTRIMSWNLIHLARMLESTPIPNLGNRVEEPDG